MKFIPLLSLLLLLAAPEAHATTVEEALAGCRVPPAFSEHQYPGAGSIAKTNNLRRRAGSSFPAEGTPIFIKGKVLDERCAPVTGARIELWQADSKGELLTDADDKDFIGAGQTYTNNLGEYSFITVLPAGIKSAAPHVNIGVRAENYKDVYTRIYFPGQPENASDPDLNKLPPSAKPYAVKYTLPGKDDVYLYNIRLATGAAEEPITIEDVEDAASDEDEEGE